MKKERISRLLPLVLAVCLAIGLALPVSAAGSEEGTIQTGPYLFTIEDGKAYLEHYDSTQATSDYADIPATVTDGNGQEYPVAGIEWYAFQNASITGVTIPDSVTSMGSYVFQGCTNLTDVTLGEGINVLRYTFEDCTSLNTLTIPAGVVEMEDPFDGCISLETVYMKGLTAPLFDFGNHYDLTDQIIFIVPQGTTDYTGGDWRYYTVIHEGDPIPTYGITLSPSILDFGSSPSFNKPDPKAVTVTNTGDMDVIVDLPNDRSDWIFNWDRDYAASTKAIDIGCLDPGESCTFIVEPRSSSKHGTHNETITVTTLEGASADLTLSYTVLTPSLQVSADTDAIDFGTVEEGYIQPAARTVTYTNGDAYPAYIELTSNSALGFLISHPMPHIEGYGTTTLTVQPKAGLKPGTYTQVLRVFTSSSSHLVESSQIKIPLTFTVVEAGQLPEEPQPEPQPTQPFTDVTADKWYYDFVETVAEKKLFAGNGDGTFAPEANMTYAEFLAVLFQFSGDTLPTNSGPNWYDNHIQWAKDHDLIPAGMLNGFDPEAAITRQDMAALFGSFLSNYDYTAAPVNSGTPSFSDGASIADYARDGVELCYQLGIMGGNDDGTFAPGNTAIRAEVAVTMVQMARVMGR